MNLLRYSLLLAVAFSMSLISAYADHRDGGRIDFDEELNERDFDALRQFINSKRTLDLKEKSCNLTISGDVRTEWRHLNETCCGKSILGNRRVFDDKGVPLGRNDFDIEFNFRLDYINDYAWAVAHVDYDNAAGVDPGIFKCHRKEVNCKDGVCTGEHKSTKVRPLKNNCDCCHKQKHIMCIGDNLVRGSLYGCRCNMDNDPNGWQGSGTHGGLNLRKAYMGINLFDDCGARFDIELGRRNLYNVFDSKVQFLSRFDGILLKYEDTNGCIADWYLYWGGFVVDERVNQFGWVTELGLENICDCCLDFKYSYIFWPKHGVNRCGVRNPVGFKFHNSQFTLVYHYNPEFINVPVKLYGAIVSNHGAPTIKIRKLHDKVEDEHINECIKVFDDADCDTLPVSGFTHLCKDKVKRFCPNNAWYIGFTLGKVCEQGDWAFDFQYQYVEALSIPDRDVSGIGRGNFLGQSFTTDSRGNTNYQGWRTELLYAITDDLTLDMIWEQSKAICKAFGGPHTYSKFELEAIYAF